MNTLDFPGKPLSRRFFKLSFKISPVVIIDNEIYSPGEIPGVWQNHIKQCLPKFQDLNFEIALDDHTIFQSNFDCAKTTKFVKWIDDLDQIEHKLIFMLQGKTDDHSWLIPGTLKNATMAVKFYFEIEDLPVIDLFYQHTTYKTNTEIKCGSTVMGENGIQIMSFECPIYSWLFQYRNLISRAILES